MRVYTSKLISLFVFAVCYAWLLRTNSAIPSLPESQVPRFTHLCYYSQSASKQWSVVVRVQSASSTWVTLRWRTTSWNDLTTTLTSVACGDHAPVNLAIEWHSSFHIETATRTCEHSFVTSIRSSRNSSFTTASTSSSRFASAMSELLHY